MSKFISPPPEISGTLGKLQIRQDFINNVATVYFKDLEHWHPDTKQYVINSWLIHFVEPDGKTIVGIKARAIPGGDIQPKPDLHRCYFNGYDFYGSLEESIKDNLKDIEASARILE